MKTPAHLYLEVAVLIPFGDDANAMAADPDFRGAVDHAYHAGWRDHEQLIIDRVSDEAKAKITYIHLIANEELTASSLPPEVYP